MDFWESLLGGFMGGSVLGGLAEGYVLYGFL